MRSAAPAALLLFLTACGGAASAPTSPSQPGIPLNLSPGSYTLHLQMSQTGTPVCTGSICSSISLCVGPGSGPTMSIAIPVQVGVDGAAIAVRPTDVSSTFRMDLRRSGSVLEGTALGQFRSGPIQVDVAGQRLPEAPVKGVVVSPFASGSIDGQVTIDGYGCSNNGHGWTLAPAPGSR